MEVLRSSSLDEMRQRNYQDFRVHFTEYAIMMDERWASDTSDDENGVFLVLEVSPLLRRSVDIYSLVGTPSPRV